MLLALGLVAIAAAAWLEIHADRIGIPHRGTDAATQVSSNLPVDSVLQVRPASSNGPGAATRIGQLPLAAGDSPPLRQFRERRDLASLYRTVASDPSPEARYLRAEIYALCARRDDKSSAARADEQAAFRSKFVAGVARSGADTNRRVDALDRLNRSVCDGLDFGKVDPAALARMVAEAANAGDMRAQAWQLADRLERTRLDAKSGAFGGYDITEDDFAQARALLATGKPEVIEDLQGVLSSTLARGMVELGGLPIDNQAMYQALSLLACDAGASCGPDSPMLLRECAYRGRCDAGSYYEYLFYYQTSPSEAQTIDNYRRMLSAMLRSGDLSGLTFVQGAGVPGFSMTFGGRRPYANADVSSQTGASPMPPPPKRKPAEMA
jgi:hypothetical protein